jgi:hypothetical protein
MMLTTEPAMMMDTVTPVQMTANTASSSGAVHATLEPVLLETLEPVLETLEPVLEPRPVRQGNLIRILLIFLYIFAKFHLSVNSCTAFFSLTDSSIPSFFCIIMFSVQISVSCRGPSFL